MHQAGTGVKALQIVPGKQVASDSPNAAVH